MSNPFESMSDDNPLLTTAPEQRDPCRHCGSLDHYSVQCAPSLRIEQRDPAVEAIVEQLTETTPDRWEMTRQSHVIAIRRAVEATLKLAEERGLRECGTCGCTGLMEVTTGCDSIGNELTEEVTCGECNGTGIGDWGQMLADAKAEGALAEREALAKVVAEMAHVVSRGTDTASAEYFNAYLDALIDAEKAIRARSESK